jgi:hypothetical protein
MADNAYHGPIDFVLMEFPEQEPSGKVAAELLELVESGTVRLYDVIAVTKGVDGGYSEVDLAGLADVHEGFGRFAGARSGLLADEDVAEVAGAMEPGTIGVLIVYENAWAIPFVAAASEAGGQVIASARITADDVMEALEAAEAAG